ncbi:MAG: nucleotidyltransferase family protein [candidate division KSB1 bacterium]|nr:nucleotidyltransferase family protein [candidate division KSB1 bacterium]MDZ7368486.1 nucleotidyltransferase family protein [candidate division KSB1 bacterium]MDZ7406212.1 nucleotidyltransferase family protein [candidate division KSB1 bacterium]
MSERFPSVLGLEENILLGCARLDIDEQTRVKLDDLLRPQVDWEKLLQRSVEQSMTPLLYRHLQGQPQWWARVPEMLRMKLEQIFRRNRQRNCLLLLELDQLFAMFEAAQIPVILMKELHLLHTVYQEPGLRPIGDLDLLVPQKDFEHAKNILGEAGYHPQLAANPFKDKYGFGYHFVNRSKGIWIDLQWNLSQREWSPEERRDQEFRAPIEEIWKRATPGRLQNSRAWRMSWEDLLFHLCVHAEGHGFEEMIQFCDMAEVIRLRGENFDWQLFSEITRRAHMQGSVFCALTFVQKVLGVRLPGDILEQLRPGHLQFGLYNACFGTLGRLHTFLDESANDASVPTDALRQWEAMVRHTAARDLKAYEALTSMTQSLADAGFIPVALLTSGPEQLLPHPNLEQIGEVEILAAKKPSAEDSAPVVEQKCEQAVTGGIFLDGTAILSRWWAASQKFSSRQLLKKMRQSPQRQPARPVLIHLMAPEDILFVLCRRFSHHAPWLALSLISEFLRNISDGLNWQKFWEKTHQLQAANEIACALRSVVEFTSIELPAAALQPLEQLQTKPRVELFPLDKPEPASALELKRAMLKIYRFFLLSNFSDRKDYLINHLNASFGAGGGIQKFWKPFAAAGRFLGLLLRNKIQRWRPKPSALQAYWLETPRVFTTKTVRPDRRHSKTAAPVIQWPELAIT